MLQKYIKILKKPTVEEMLVLRFRFIAEHFVGSLKSATST